MTAFRLGIQLAVTRGARLRTLLLLLAAALAALVLLTTLTAGRFELDHATSYQAEMPRIVAAVVAAVALPCLTLLATTARLSAALRDRRLANLRLIGLTPGQTRLVAAAETGVAAALGGMELGEQLGIPGVYGPVSEAAAIVGRPLTPVSVAGVGRRTVRRCAAGVYYC